MTREYDYEWQEVFPKAKRVAEEPYGYCEGSELDELYHSSARWVVPVFFLGAALSARPLPYDLLTGLSIVVAVKGIQLMPLVITRMLGQYLYD